MKNTKWLIKNPEHSQRVQEFLFSKGCKWHDGSTVKYTHAVVLFVDGYNKITYNNSKDYYDSHRYIPMELPFGKCDLETGMILRFECGDAVVIKSIYGEHLYYRNGGWDSIDVVLDMELNHKSRGKLLGVYQVDGTYNMFYDINKTLSQQFNLIWKPEEPVVEMTMADICKALGKTIKVVKGS